MAYNIQSQGGGFTYELDICPERPISKDSIYVDVLRGLEHYSNPMDERFHHHLTTVTKMAMVQNNIIMKATLEQFIASYKDEKRIVRTIDEADIFGRNPLHWTVGADYLTAYKKLLDLGAAINCVTLQEGFTALMVACRKGGSLKATRYLLDHKADITIKSKNSATAFHIATASGSRDCMRYLLSRGADPYMPLEDGRTPIDLASDDVTKALVYSCQRSAAIREEKKGVVCANCDGQGVKLDRCGKCYVTFYCSRKCQSNHWSEVHRTECKGSVSASTLQRQPKTYYVKAKSTQRKLEKTFLVEITVNKEDKNNTEFLVNNTERKLEAKLVNLAEETMEEMLNHFTNHKLPRLYFWAKYTDASNKNDIIVYHGSPVPIKCPDYNQTQEMEVTGTS